MKKIIPVLTASFLFQSATVALAETVKYTGTGRSEGSEQTLTLGNGDTVVFGRSDGVATLSTKPPSLLDTRCVSLGVLVTENQYTGDFYCTLRNNDGDTVDLKGREESGKGTLTVIGGSGTWQDATGSGQYKITNFDKHVSTYTYELTITTP